MNQRFFLRLPATSANLGPAFDTAAVALQLHLEVRAEPADAFSISAVGRDAAACGRLERNLVLDTYRQILSQENRRIVPIHLDVKNGIPLGMGCGSSAAARLAGITLAMHFGDLNWTQERLLAVATDLEGHPDNVSACWLGGMTVSAVAAEIASSAMERHTSSRWEIPQVSIARLDVPLHWRAVLVLPRDPVRTEESRKVLPDHYSRADTVANLQHCALLVAAFASGRDDLLRAAMQDRVHQPYRSDICPVFKKLQRISQSKSNESILGVALSGAGPGVLLIVQQSANNAVLQQELQAHFGNPGETEVLFCGFECHGAVHDLECLAQFSS